MDPWRRAVDHTGAREAESVEALLTEVAVATGINAGLDRSITDLTADLADPGDPRHRARRTVERAALVLQGSLLVRHAPTAVAAACCATGLGGGGGGSFCTPPAVCVFDAVIDRASPTDA